MGIEYGYHWIKMKNYYNEWQPAKWDGENWGVIGTEELYSDSDITEVGEKIRKPNEKED